MNDPMLAAENFENLASLARDASTPFEKAAIFAAAQALANEFLKEKLNAYGREKVEKARWHICAIVGYDITNGHSLEKHLVWALGEIHSLKDVLRQGKAVDF